MSAARQAADLGGTFEGPGLGPRSRSSSAPGGVRGEERLVGRAALEQVAVDGQRDDHIGAGAERQVEVGLAGHRRGARIDDDDGGAARRAPP